MWIAIEILFFVTWIVVTGTTLTLGWRLRRTPRDIVQLLMFERHTLHARALVLFGLGSVAGMLSLGPVMLGLNPPIVWYLVFTGGWSYGLLSACRLFLKVFSLKRSVPALG